MNRPLRDLSILTIVGLVLATWLGCHEAEDSTAEGRAAALEQVASSPRATQGGFVGVARCAGCHADEAARFRGSHHDRALEPASAESVLGRFDGRILRDFERTWRFLRDGEAFVVEVVEPGEPPQRLIVESTFGVEPLQQVLVARDDGRRQALPIAWDARALEAGGQKWFSLNPDEWIARGDPLHWEEPAYNWNSQCASCHSTAVARGFDFETNRFDTRAAEADVACEACHGPGAKHVARMEAGRGSQPSTVTPVASDFDVSFEAWVPSLWQRRAGERVASRSAARVHDAELDVCSPCHSRRSELVTAPAVGAPFLDGHAPQLILPGLYFEDGQIRDEVYVWGSFVQSRMFQAGVRCSDCHDPHSLELRREGNALCSGCHDSASFDVPEHRGHASLESGIDCVGCHMPERVYMKIDGRRDHAFPVPRPLRSEALGAPNPCRSCHAAEASEWAENALLDWRGERPALERWPDRLVSGDVARTDAERWVEIALDGTLPSLVRGSAWARYAEEASGAPSFELLRSRLEEADALEALGLITLARRLEPPIRAALLRPLLEAERRAVRVAAAEALADVPSNVWQPADRSVLARGLREYRAAQETNQERAEAQVNLGVLASRVGDPVAARRAYERAIERAPYFVPAHVNLADLERAEGQEAAAVSHLKEALRLEPGAVWVRYALGLAYYRSGDLDGALRELERAAREEPAAAPLTLGWALALDAGGRRRDAIEVLSRAVDRGVANVDVWQALVTFLRDEGRKMEASARVRTWLDLEPGNPSAQALLLELDRPASAP